MPQLGEEVYRLCDTLVDDVVCVSDDEIREAIRDCFEDTRALLEPAGALLTMAALTMATLTMRSRARCSSPQAPPRWRYIGLQAATHTVAGATSIAGLKKWAAQQQPSADGAALRQYVAVASDACNIEFDFLGKPHGQARRRGSGRSGHLRLEAPSRWHMPSGSVWAPKQSCYGRVGPRIRALQPCPAASPGRRPKR